MKEMIITKHLLESLDIEINYGDSEEAYICKLNEILQERIGAEITRSLNDKQLKELIDLQSSGDDLALQAWLVNNVPELKDIVDDEVDILLGQISENAKDV